MHLCLLIWPAMAVADGHRVVTEAFGIGVIQDGVPLPMAETDNAYLVKLAAAPFALGPARTDGQSVMLAIGRDRSVFDRFGDPQDPLFGPASAYARYAEPGATLYLTDPACRPAGTPSGFNMLGPEHAAGGVYPVERIEPDRGSDACTAWDRLASGENVIAAGRSLYLVVSDGEGADFIILEFPEAPGA